MKVSTIQVQLINPQWGEESDDLGTLSEKALNRAHLLIYGWCQVERIPTGLGGSKTFEAPGGTRWVDVNGKTK